MDIPHHARGHDDLEVLDHSVGLEQSHHAVDVGDSAGPELDRLAELGHFRVLFLQLNMHDSTAKASNALNDAPLQDYSRGALAENESGKGGNGNVTVQDGQGPLVEPVDFLRPAIFACEITNL